MGDSVHRRRLIFAGDDERRAAMRLEILGDRRDPGRLVAGIAARARDTDGRGDRARQGLDVGRTPGQPVIRLRAGQRGRALHRIQPVHRLALFGDAPAVREVAGVTHHPWTGGQEVGIEREDDVSLVEVVERLGGPAGGLLRAGAGAVTGNRVVLVPLGLRIRLENGRDELGQRRRRQRAAQDPQPGAARAFLLGQRVRQSGAEVGPAAELVAEARGLGRGLGRIAQERRPE